MRPPVKIGDLVHNLNFDSHLTYKVEDLHATGIIVSVFPDNGTGMWWLGWDWFVLKEESIVDRILTKYQNEM